MGGGAGGEEIRRQWVYIVGAVLLTKRENSQTSERGVGFVFVVTHIALSSNL